MVTLEKLLIIGYNDLPGTNLTTYPWIEQSNEVYPARQRLVHLSVTIWFRSDKSKLFIVKTEPFTLFEINLK